MTHSPGHARRLFVDTSAFYALIDEQDQWHRQAQEALQSLIETGRLLVTLNLVVAETYRLVLHRQGRAVAVRWLSGLQLLDVTVLFQIQEEHDLTVAFLRTAPTNLTYTDAACFATMRNRGIRTAFSFDQDYDYAGFTRVPPAHRQT